MREVLIDNAWLMDVFQHSKVIFTGSLRDMHECDRKPEPDDKDHKKNRPWDFVNDLVTRDDRTKEIQWFPEIVDFIGKCSF